MEGVDSSPPSIPSSAPVDAPSTPDAGPAAAPETPQGPADGFGATPQEDNAAKFAQTNGPDGANNADPDAATRERVSTAVQGALDNVPGLGDETKKGITQGVQDTAAAVSKAFGVPLSALEKVDIGFNVNGSVINGGLSGTVFPQDKQGHWDASLGLSTPNRPGASVSAGLTFRASPGITPDGTPGLSGTVTAPVPGLGDVTFKAGTDGTFTVQRDLPGLSVGGGVPNAGVEVNIPLNETAQKLAGATPQDLRWQANDITNGQAVRSEADYRAAQSAINGKYDALVKGAANPSMAQALEQERGAALSNLQRNQVRTDQMIQQLNKEMLRRINP